MRTSIGFGLVAMLAMSRGAAADDVDFARQVRPIFSNTCYACHGPDKRQRKSEVHFDTRAGAFLELDGQFAIVPGKPNQSILIQRINAVDPDLVMPPPDSGKKLTGTQKRLLADWIRQGASWQDHWAYTPPIRHQPPQTQHPQRVRNIVDAFINHRLDIEGIRPAPQADKRTLLRRLAFDLTGLPPNLEAHERFTSDTTAQAYEQVVDRLLGSREYGERMAVHWLDLVRYADSVGYHGDQLVSMSPYRDYVISAFNSNVPFDRFTREQLAGDLLPRPSRDQLVASGYNRLGMMSAEGGVQPEEYLAKYASDRVRTAAAVWMGSTLGCAECHEHKFDPFTSADFYRFAAFFADIKEKGLYSGANTSGDWGPKVDVPDPSLAKTLEPMEHELLRLRKIMATQTPELDTAQRKWEVGLRTRSLAWHVLQPLTATALHGTQLKPLKDASLLAGGANPGQNVYTVTCRTSLTGITGFRLEVLPDASLPRQGPGRAGNGNFVVSELRVSLADDQDSSPFNVALQNASATIEQSIAGDVTPYGKWSAASAIDQDIKGSSWGWAILPDAGKPNQMVVESARVLATGKTTQLKFVIEQKHTNPRHTLGRFRLSATQAPHPLSADRSSAVPQDIRRILALQQTARNRKQTQSLAAYYRSISPVLADVRSQITRQNQRKQALIKQNTRTSLITVAVAPRTIRVLPRGDWMNTSGRVVQPGVPHFLRQIPGTKRASRLELAAWMTARDNPLTARVFVNRLWKMFFGQGLSRVLDDLGGQGTPPTHPKLLDTLAVEFMESGWNVKMLVKRIVMSAAYRRSSLPRPELADRDPYNRLLARQSRFRLEAEFIRDNALAVSGLLVSDVGGRSVRPYQPAGLYRHLNFPRRTYQQDEGDHQYRRGVYTHWQRQFLHPAMKIFDAPPREECVAERPRSNTPLAALVLLNDPSYVEAARVFAQHAIQRGGDSTEQRVEWMVKHALSRTPNAEEARLLGDLWRAHAVQYKAQPEPARQLIQIGLAKVPDGLQIWEVAAWTSVARTIFNMHEFITRN